eukprot:59680-Hanusia_phi.AAC.1
MVIRHVSDRAEPRRTRPGREFASDRRTVRNILRTSPIVPELPAPDLIIKILSRTREIKNRAAYQAGKAYPASLN